jgi:hypothetical protein
VGLPTNALNKIFMTLYSEVDNEEYYESIAKALLKKKGSAKFPSNEEKDIMDVAITESIKQGKEKILDIPSGFYKDLKYTSTGERVLPDYNGNGYLWRKVGLKQQTQDKISQIESMLSSQSFTTKEPEDLTSDESKYSFYFKDIKNDWPGLTSQAGVGRDDDVIYPMNEILYPDKKTCRTTIKKLYNCITSDTARDCGVDLFKNKFIALRCESPKIGGIFGLEDEFDRIKLNGGPYGVANLRRAVGKAKYKDIKESSIEKKINIFLNEELKKFRF